MIINNPTTRKNLNEFLSLAMSKGKKQGLNKGQLDSLYNNAISVFFFNDLEKLAKVTRETVNYLWCGMSPLYY